MKGTRPRGRWSQEDEALAEALRGSGKDRAENLMIVDLLRNDVGRVAEYGTVRAPNPFVIERYPTVFQLTSTIEARLRNQVRLPHLFQALFPSGSVTGAPKIRTSQIIQELEPGPRGLYTGAIGFVSGESATFSVAIRTAVIDREAGRLSLGVGSGITVDSDPAMEYRECLTKGTFLRYRMPEFELLESLRLDRPGGYSRLERHLARMATSARYFDFHFDREGAEAALRRVEEDLAAGAYKVRLLSDARGVVRTEALPLSVADSPMQLRLSTVRISSFDRFLYHKTTHRELYERAAAFAGGCDDVILTNERGEVTETTTGNLVIEIDGELITPPVESGLLPGVFRAQLLDEGLMSERVIMAGDLSRASRIHVVNSVRGWRSGILA